MLWASSAILLLSFATSTLYWANPSGGAGVGWRGFPLDDAWIHLVYARSVATRLLPEYNPGQLESGMSSPLWVLLNAALYWPQVVLRLDPTLVPKFLSTLFGAICALAVYLLLRARTPARPIAAAAALLLSIDPQWCFSRAAGMEATFFAALLLCAVLALERRRWAWLGWAVGLAVIARPEGLPVAAVLLPLGFYLAEAWRPGRRIIAAQLLLPLIGLFGGWVVFNLFVTGRPLPNTFYIKAGNARLWRPQNLSFLLREIVWRAPFLKGWVGAGLGALGVFYLLRRARVARSWNWGNLVLVVLPPLFLVALSMTHTFQQAWPYYWTRHVHPVFPFLLLLLCAGLIPLWTWIARLAWTARWPGWRWVGRAALAALVLVGVAAPSTAELPATAALFSRNCGDVDNANVAVGRWLEQHTRPDEYVATMDAGAIRYFSQRPVLDVVGLNNHRVARSHDWPSEAARVKPVYVALLPSELPPLSAGMALNPVLVLSRKEYSICNCPLQKTLIVLATSWNHRPLPDRPESLMTGPELGNK